VVLSAHYRSEQNFHVELLNSAWRSLDSLYSFLRTANDLDALAVDLKAAAGYKALLDDLNTPIALSELHRLARDMQQATGQRRQQLKYELLGVADLLGLLQQNPDDWFTRARSNDAMAADEIEAAISARQSAKESGDYGTADEIRKNLETRGVILEDGRQGTQWRRG
jgi:cysteinyl-tRNA synthetase